MLVPFRFPFITVRSTTKKFALFFNYTEICFGEFSGDNHFTAFLTVIQHQYCSLFLSQQDGLKTKREAVQ